jgi:hypothetical protein
MFAGIFTPCKLPPRLSDGSRSELVVLYPIYPLFNTITWEFWIYFGIFEIRKNKNVKVNNGHWKGLHGFLNKGKATIMSNLKNDNKSEIIKQNTINLILANFYNNSVLIIPKNMQIITKKSIQIIEANYWPLAFGIIFPYRYFSMTQAHPWKKFEFWIYGLGRFQYFQEIKQWNDWIYVWKLVQVIENYFVFINIVAKSANPGN